MAPAVGQDRLIRGNLLYCNVHLCDCAGCDQWYVEENYAPIARKGWEGVMAKIQSDGQIEGVCTGTGVGDDLEFYYKRPTPLNDEHCIGAVLLAGAEVTQLPN